MITDLKEPAMDDVLLAEPVFHGSPQPQSPLPASVAKAQPAKPSEPESSPVVEKPLDPIAARDKKTAGENPVVVRLLGRDLGTAYMFTNPQAPVMSLEAFSHLFNRPVLADRIGEHDLKLSLGRESFVTQHFLVLDNRVWLILKPELVERLGFKLVSHGNGAVDFELKL